MLRIITDSTAEFTAEEAQALGIEVVPMTVVFGENAYLEGEELGKEEFYTRLLEGEYPRTAQPSPMQFTEAYVHTNGEETLVMVISSALSGTVNAARIAKEEGGFSNVHIYETACTTAMLRILIEEALKNREKTAAEVIALLDELRPRIKLLACLDTLEYLYKGGRIKKSLAIVGGLLGIKPLISIWTDGTVQMVGRAHGRKRALKSLADAFLADKTDPDYPVYFLQTNTDRLAREVMEMTGNADARIFRICCAVGTHIGPDAAGLVWVSKK